MECTTEHLQNLLGETCYSMYDQLNAYILDNYNVDQLWNTGGKYGDICLRYSRSKKTLLTLYFRKRQLGVWIILGKEERSKFEESESRFSEAVRNKVHSTAVFHDGQWLMFDVEDDRLLPDLKQLLSIKKSPNRNPHRRKGADRP